LASTLKRKGFTLAELLVGLGVLSMVMIAAFTLLSSSLLVGSNAEVKSQVENLALSILDEQRAKPFEDLQPAEAVALPEIVLDGAIVRPELEIRSKGPYARELQIRMSWRAKQRLTTLEYATVVVRMVQ
jgi:prepilin-type N-terminal cleavage/methylation domain-containing protein